MLGSKFLCRRCGTGLVRLAAFDNFRFRGWETQRMSVRPSTTGGVKQRRILYVETDMKARAVVSQLYPDERARLLEALAEVGQMKDDNGDTIPVPITRQQMHQLFTVNLAPFIGFGILDNMVMIFAGEYIDRSLGTWLAISTMAAAALGNIISDIAGVGLAHYVEFCVSKFGMKHPVLTSEQLESPQARLVVNVGRAAGLVIGCLIGMFPLLFFDSN